MTKYRNCTNISTTLSGAFCNSYLEKTCPQRFGKTYSRSNECKEGLGKEESVFRNKNMTDYLNCMLDLSNDIKNCVNQIKDQCDQSEFISMKTVRLSMEFVDKLLQFIPDLKVIHMIRDPRPVALSRYLSEFVRGVYASGPNRTVLAAQLYCQDLIRDLQISKQLKTKYPHTILEVYFEELATFPELIAARIYEFIGRPLKQEVKDWIDVYTHGGGEGWTSRNSIDIVNKWMDEMTTEIRLEINKQCRDVFNVVDIKWPQTEI